MLTETTAAKVNVFIESSGQSSTEVMTEIRQQLRSLSDVQIVYSVTDADAVISIMSYENQTAGYNQSLGYTASIVTSSPCVSRFGTDSWNFRIINNQYLRSFGRDSKSFAQKLVAELDSDDFEPIRQQHAAYLKYLKQEKK